MIKTKTLFPYVERKLFTVNTGHIIAAHMGFYKSYNTIDEAVLDPEIRETVVGAMRESGAVLVKRYDFDKEEHEKYIQKIIKRFENKYLGDTTVRVGREPIRKLRTNERLTRPLLGTIEYNFSNENLVKGIAYLMKFDVDTDEESVELQKEIRENGVEKTLRKITENTLSDEVIKNIITNYEKL